MSMLGSPATTNPFRAAARLTHAEVTAYVVSALTKRGYSNVAVTYLYDSRGSEWDRFATPSYEATITGTKDGKPEQEKISFDAVKATLIAELEADGVAFDKESVSLSYSTTDRTVSANVVLLVPRKR
jgi:hypothetical protein